MNKAKRNTIIEIAVASGVFIILAVIAGLYDLQINIALYNPGCLYGQYFAKLGELPSYLTPLVVGAILFYQDFGKTKGQKIFVKVLASIIALAGAFFAFGMWFWKNFMDEGIKFAIVYKVIFTILIGAISIGLGGLIPKKYLKTLFFFILFLAITVALTNIVAQIMKIIWARQRFRTMTSENPVNVGLNALYGSDFAGFSPWYKPQLLFPSAIRTDSYVEMHKAVDSDTFKSFPSGHTAAASATFALIILPELFPAKCGGKKKKIFWIIPIAYTCLVALSRIIMGAHYLSDVLFGGYVGAVITVVTRVIFNKKVLPKYDCVYKENSSETIIIVPENN